LQIDSIPESLKNMILVMYTSGQFESKVEPPEEDSDYQALTPPGEGKPGDRFNLLWKLTWKKANRFLPKLKAELFPDIDQPGNVTKTEVESRPKVATAKAPEATSTSVVHKEAVAPNSSPSGPVVDTEMEKQGTYPVYSSINSIEVFNDVVPESVQTSSPLVPHRISP
jgi:hypothetical protein